MPELPDVESFRALAQRRFIDDAVSRVAVPDPASLEGATEATLRQRLKGRRLRSAHRHGKYLFLDFGEATVLAMHFGPAGSLRHIPAGQQEPDYVRFRLDFFDGQGLAYLDPRRIGRVRLIDDAAAFVKRMKLGPDALDAGFEADDFVALLVGRTRPIKLLLMDQSKLSGIGDTWSDEILFQARIDPTMPAAELDAARRRALFRTIQSVLREAIERDPSAEDFLERLPSGFLLPHRHPGGHCPRRGGDPRRVKLGGHTATYCPRCQQPEPGRRGSRSG
jgi:formamidopyrimidine-DNA glycosylase